MGASVIIMFVILTSFPTIEVKCDPLPVPDITAGYMAVTCTLHGVEVTEIDQPLSYGTVCVTPCDLGYMGSGSGSRTCLLSGQWDGTPTQCNGKKLSDLNFIWLFLCRPILNI